jgi:ATP-dependent Clp protease adaptor protein ClpS
VTRARVPYNREVARRMEGRMVDVAQLVEHWLVVPVVAGSSPVIHPTSSVNEMSLTQPAEDLEIRETVELDRGWSTVVWNDPVNLMSYVTHVFRSYFGYPKPEAERLMLQVHRDGRATVASGPREEMERHTEAMHEFGLWATVERQ